MSKKPSPLRKLLARFGIGSKSASVIPGNHAPYEDLDPLDDVALQAAYAQYVKRLAADPTVRKYERVYPHPAMEGHTITVRYADVNGGGIGVGMGKLSPEEEESLKNWSQNPTPPVNRGKLPNLPRPARSNDLNLPPE